MITFDKAKRNVQYKIVGFNGETDNILRRFFELGFSTGQKVKIISQSSLKKVFLIEIRGYCLSVRRNLLTKINVE